MGSWDYYCALCGSTFFTSSIISRKPRTARFNRRRHRSEERKARSEAKKRLTESKQVIQGDETRHCGTINIPELLPSDSGTYESDDEEESDAESLSTFSEDNSYDPEIISEDDVAWASTLQCIGFNPDASGLSKAFISGLGTAEDYGAINVEPGDDPNFPDVPEAGCYTDYNGLDPYYPFHVTCYQLFQQQLFHAIKTICPDKSKEGVIKEVDHDLLYNVMSQLGDGGSCCLGIDYGTPEPACQEQFWEARPGEELLVTNPIEQNPLVKACILDAWEHCDVPISVRDNGHQDGQDLFARLPMELLLNITTALEPKDLRNLIISSKHISNITVGAGNTRFWLQHFEIMMPWFFELDEFLSDSRKEGSLNHSLYRLFVWADQITTPRVGKTGPFMGVANRRRIWGACQQISTRYIARATEEELFEFELPPNILQMHSSCDAMPAVSIPDKGDVTTQKCFWAADEADLVDTEALNTVDLFWSEEEASLVGLAFSFDGKAPALLGYDDSDDGLVTSKDVLSFGNGDWVQGIILYYPEVNCMDMHSSTGQWTTARLTTTILGIKIMFTKGGSAEFGNLNPSFAKRPLLAAAGKSVVGLMGNVGFVRFVDNENLHSEELPPHKEVCRILRLGLLQYCPDDDMDDDAVPWKQLPESLAWVDECTDLFANTTLDPAGHRGGLQDFSTTPAIWNIDGLRLIHCGDYHINSDIPDDIVAHHPLIWALNESERRSLVRMIVYLKYDGMVGSGQESRICPSIVGMRAEYSAASGLEARQVGVSSAHDEPHMYDESCRAFDIDGPGGEEITSVMVGIQWNENPKAIKIRTNRSREVYWGERNWNPEQNCFAERNSREFDIPDDMYLVGAALSFSNPGGYDYETKTHKHRKLSSFSCLALTSEGVE